MMRDVCAQLRERWISRGLWESQGASAKAIGSIEEQGRLTVPESLKNYLITVNGMGDGLLDENMIHFWNADEICEEMRAGDALLRSFMPIADYSFDAWAWVMPIVDGVVVDAVYTFGPPLVECRPSLASFLEAYLVGENLEPAALEAGILSWRSRSQ